MVDEGGEEEEDPVDHHIHHFDDVNAEIYLIEEEHNLFDHDDEITILVTDQSIISEDIIIPLIMFKEN